MTPLESRTEVESFRTHRAWSADGLPLWGEVGWGFSTYNARWMDPALGRFASADTIVPPGVQGLDRYAYVNNSPVNYTDPSGHFLVDDEECTEARCSEDPKFAVHILRENERDPSAWDDLTPDEQDILRAAGIGSGFWQDEFFGNAPDIGGTLADPAVYASIVIALGMTGLPQQIVTLAVTACLRSVSCAGAVARTIGLTVYRVWGPDPTNPGPNYSGPWGPSWTPVNPGGVEGFRKLAGLPDNLNLGRFLSVGKIYEMSGILIKEADSIGTYPGGLLEYKFIAVDAIERVILQQVLGINPPF